MSRVEGFAAKLSAIESLLPEIEQMADDHARETTRQVLQAVLEFHGEAIARLLDRLQHNEAGRAVLADLVDDELFASVLMLHDLHPRSLDERVSQAIEDVRPALGSHGGNVTLVDISAEGRVRLRLEGNCNGCPSSQATLKNTIEQALYAAAPEITAIDVEGVAEPTPSGFVPLTVLSVRAPV